MSDEDAGVATIRPVLGRLSPQKRHAIAARLIVSAHLGHATVSPGVTITPGAALTCCTILITCWLLFRLGINSRITVVINGDIKTASATQLSTERPFAAASAIVIPANISQPITISMRFCSRIVSTCIRPVAKIRVRHDGSFRLDSNLHS
jgi:hypothetical protein